MFFRMCFYLTPNLTDVHLAVAQYLVDDVCLMGCLILERSEWRVGARLKHRPNVEVLAHPPHPLTNTSHVREVDSQWILFLPSLSSLDVLLTEAEQMKE